MFTHPKSETARIIGQIQGCYKNVDTLIKPTINQIEFEKAIKEDKIAFYFDEVIKAYATSTLEAIEAETDEVKKSEIAIESKNNFSTLENVNVVFDNIVKSIYVDVIDINTNTYKDNAINRKFERVGNTVK
jgi:hypothetical protein